MRYKNEAVLLVCTVFLSIFHGFSQVPDENLFGGYGIASIAKPQAASVAQSSGPSVGLATGTIQQQVSLHEISLPNFKWPVALAYSYSGLKVIEEPSLIGLGWNLSATGMVSRELRGLPDEHPYGYLGENMERRTVLERFLNAPEVSINERGNPSNTGYDIKLLKEHEAYKFAQSQWDSELDVFHVNIGRINFSFKLDMNSNPVFLSHENVKVDFSWDEIIITDTNGIAYYLSEKEHYKPVDSENPILFGNQYPDIAVGYTNAWYLSKIKLPTSDQEVNFEYEVYNLDRFQFVPKFYSGKSAEPEFLQEMARDTMIGGEPQTFIHPDDIIDGGVYPYTRLPVEVAMPVISKIVFPNGFVEFNTIIENDYPVLKDVKIFNSGELNNPVNHFEFSQSMSNRRFLDSILLNSTVYRKFDYYDRQTGVPDYQYKVDYANPDLNYDHVKYGMDFWGYFNGRASSNALRGDISSSSRLPEFYTTRKGALKKIGLPTGGFSEIFYEPNTVKELYDPQLQRRPFDRKILLSSHYNINQKSFTLTLNEDTYGYISYSARTHTQGSVGNGSDWRF